MTRKDFKESSAARGAWGTFWEERQTDVPAARSAPWEDQVWRVGLEYWHAIFVQAAPGGRLLECGCGTARLSRYMAAKGFNCTMLDYDVGAVRLARRGFTESGLGGAYAGGDIERLPFADASFDVVYSGGVLQHFRNFRPAIAEMARVLRPGGLFAANVIPDKVSIQTVADWQRTAVRTIRRLAQGRLRDAFTPVRHLPDFYVSPANLTEYLDACGAAGLDAVGFASSPFPNLSLPRFASRLYAHAMNALVGPWRRFNRSASPWALRWGIGYAIHGIKASQGSR